MLYTLLFTLSTGFSTACPDGLSPQNTQFVHICYYFETIAKFLSIQNEYFHQYSFTICIILQHKIKTQESGQIPAFFCYTVSPRIDLVA